MKKILGIIGLLVLTGCLSNKPPTALEQKYFNIETNLVEVAVPTTTNVIDGIPTVVPGMTSVVETYDYVAPSEAAEAVQGVGGVVGSFFGVGELVSGALGGLFGLWGLLRSKKSNKTAAALVQVIETGRQLLQNTPQGQRLDEKWVAWMVKHQAEQRVINEVVKLMGQAVDTESAKIVSAKILELMQRENQS
jgi:hypothetical protein